MAAYPDTILWAVYAGVSILAGTLCTTILIVLLPWFRSHALARPVDRSSHREPTPQGGGLGVVLSTILAAWLGVIVVGIPQDAVAQLSTLAAAALILTLIGLADDIYGLSPVPRLLAQCLAVGLVVAALPTEMRLVSALPIWLERPGLVLGWVWFVNLVNFMDGIDWMTVAETVPITGAIAVLGLSGTIAVPATLIALALLGAILGFAPFNKPVARLFLGDVGSLPIGLILGWLLLLLALNGQFAAAFLLPLYYLADATITLALRIHRREPIFQAHRSHFYQRAVAGGLSVSQVIARVLATNLVLVALALISNAADNLLISLLCIIGGGGLVGCLLKHFAIVRR